jgi:SAM-dependent methyltransferase
VAERSVNPRDTNVGGESTSPYDESVRLYGLNEAQRCILSHVPGRSAVLELGASSGYMTKELVDAGCVVDAIEINPEDAAKASRYCRRIVVGSVEESESFASLTGPYDVVLMADILEHLRSPESALRQARSRLTATGQALVCLPNIGYYRMRMDLLKGRFTYADYGLLDRTHLRFYTLKSAIDLFAASGFSTVEVIVPPPRVPKWGKLKAWVKTTWPTLFAIQIIYRLKPLHSTVS